MVRALVAERHVDDVDLMRGAIEAGDVTEGRDKIVERAGRRAPSGDRGKRIRIAEFELRGKHL